MMKLNFVVIGVLFSSILAVQSRNVIRTTTANPDFLHPGLQHNTNNGEHYALRAKGQITPSENESGSTTTEHPEFQNPGLHHNTNHGDNSGLRANGQITPSENESGSTTTAHPEFQSHGLQNHTNNGDHSGLRTKGQITPSENESGSNASHTFIGRDSTVEGSVSEGTTVSQTPIVVSRNHDSRSRHHHDLRTSTEKVTSPENDSTTKNSRRPLSEVRPYNGRISESSTSHKPTLNSKNSDDSTTHRTIDISTSKSIRNVPYNNVQKYTASEESISDGTTPIPKNVQTVTSTETINKSTTTITATNITSTTTTKPWYKRIFN